MENTINKQCYSCAYRSSIPGNCHSKCTFDFMRNAILPPDANPHGIKSGWYNFPFNYDPVWQTSKCAAHSSELDTSKVGKYNPLLELLSMLR